MPDPKLPKFEDWTPPWGSDHDDCDPEQAAKKIYDLLNDKQKLQVKVSDANTKVTEAQAETEQVRKELTEAAAKGADEKLVGANKRAEEAEAKAKKAEADALKFQVALDKGLTKVQAKRLVGSTEEELAADAEELLESFGGASRKADDEEGEEDGEDKVLTQTPKRRLVNPSDDGDGPVDYSDSDITKWVESRSTSFI